MLIRKLMIVSSEKIDLGAMRTGVGAVATPCSMQRAQAVLLDTFQAKLFFELLHPHLSRCKHLLAARDLPILFRNRLP